MSTIHVIDLFSGAGGFSAGVQMAGHTVIACVDQWEKGLAIHHANFKDVAHVNLCLGGDKLSFVKAILALVEQLVPPGETWHLHASPPCQSFSIAQRQKKTISALADAELDARSNLLSWSLDVIQMLDPPRWSLEQVPTALPFLEKHCNWIFEETSGVRIYPKVFGFEFGAATMRKRLLIGKGWSLNGQTTPFGTKKRLRFNDADSSLGLYQTCPLLCNSILVELNSIDDRGYEICDLAIKTSANKWCTSISERKYPLANSASGPALGKSKWVPCSEGQGLRPLSGRPCFAAIASYALVLYKRVSREPIRNHKTYLDGTWVKWRSLKPSELAAIQGFPATYRIDDLSSIELEYYNDLALGTKMTSTVKLTRANQVRGIGNSVVPLIAKAILSSTS